MAKAISVRKIKPSAICLGTSRAVVGIDPSHPGWSYTPVYNLGIIGANIYEMTRYLQHANALQPLKQVVVMLDFLSFNIYRENRSDFDEARLAVRYDGQKNPLFMVNNEIVASLVSVDTLFESIKTINHQVENGFEYLENGMRIGLLPSMKGGHHAYFLRTAESYITDSYLPNPYRQFQFTNPKTGRSSFDYYRKIVQIAYQDDIDLHHQLYTHQFFSILSAISIQGHTFEVTLVRDGYYAIFLGDEVLDIEVLQFADDLGATGVAVFLPYLVEVLTDDVHDQRFLG